MLRVSIAEHAKIDGHEEDFPGGWVSPIEKDLVVNSFLLGRQTKVGLGLNLWI